MRVVRAGPWARHLVLGESPSPALSRDIGLLARHLRSRLSADHDVVPGHLGLLVEGRYLSNDAALARLLAGAEHADHPPPRRFEVPVGYGQHADRSELTARLGLPWEAITQLHAAADYSVAYLGFTPGFPYLHGLDSRLRLPRRDRPRPDIPAGAVAIAGDQSGIYPSAGPGGWWLLGTTSFTLFDRSRAEPTTLRTGDEVRFVPGSRPQEAPLTPQPVSPAPPRPAPPAEPVISVTEVWPASASLQGEPRRGVGHFGLAEAGALDQWLLRLLRGALDMPAGSAALELTVPRATLRAERDVLAVYGGAMLARIGREELAAGTPFHWRQGTLLELSPAGGQGLRHSAARSGVPLLAVAGGLAPLGGQAGHETLTQGGSTDVRGGVGGFGRWLRAGDVLVSGGATTHATGGAGRRVLLGSYPERLVLRLHPGPDHLPELFAELQSRELRFPAAAAGDWRAAGGFGGYVVAERSRMGVRLEPAEGGALSGPDAVAPSAGVPLGAVQLPPDGCPIVLLADRGRTGGYPVVGVVDRRDLGALAQAAPGTRVTFSVPHRA